MKNEREGKESSAFKLGWHIRLPFSQPQVFVRIFLIFVTSCRNHNDEKPRDLGIAARIGVSCGCGEGSQKTGFELDDKCVLDSDANNAAERKWERARSVATFLSHLETSE